jgi:hypothetical protein
MNRIFLACLLLFSFTYARGQYVLIPDSNFRHALISKGFASCFDSTQTMLDTTCSSVLAATELIVAHKYIISLEGVQYFKSLTHLDCDGNHIDSISYLPPLLRYFDCSANYIEKIPALPVLLDTLDCYFNHLDSLPALPNTLSYLYCAVNPIGSLPALPSSLTTLICFENLLDSLPPLPGSLSYLNCEGNYVTNLPTLPDSLAYFNCSNNINLECRPHLNIVVNFNFSGTAITCLPDTPADNLTMNPANTPVCNAPCYPSGIHDLNISALKIYPNPVTDRLYIDYSQDASFVVCDMTGRVLVSTMMDKEIDVSNLPSGVYILRVQSDNGTVVNKFVKE